MSAEKKPMRNWLLTAKPIRPDPEIADAKYRFVGKLLVAGNSKRRGPVKTRPGSVTLYEESGRVEVFYSAGKGSPEVSFKTDSIKVIAAGVAGSFSVMLDDGTTVYIENGKDDESLNNLYRALNKLKDEADMAKASNGKQLNSTQPLSSVCAAMCNECKKIKHGDNNKPHSLPAAKTDFADAKLQFRLVCKVLVVAKNAKNSSSAGAAKTNSGSVWLFEGGLVQIYYKTDWSRGSLELTFEASDISAMTTCAAGSFSVALNDGTTVRVENINYSEDLNELYLMLKKLKKQAYEAT